MRPVSDRAADNGDGTTKGAANSDTFRRRRLSGSTEDMGDNRNDKLADAIMTVKDDDETLSVLLRRPGGDYGRKVTFIRNKRTSSWRRKKLNRDVKDEDNTEPYISRKKYEPVT